jgi:hypothetical protein
MKDGEASCGGFMQKESPSAQSRVEHPRPVVRKEKVLAEISELMGSCRSVASKHNREG